MLLRNQMRGVFRYGALKAWRLRRRMARESVEPKHFLAVCAIMKNEGTYLAEWIDWHHAMGVEKFYLYDNDSDDDTRAVLEPYIASGLVEYVWFPGVARQLAAYDDCFERHRLDAQWIAVIDIDEFIVPMKHRTLREFMQTQSPDVASVEINWLCYGSSGHKERTPGGVMERFTRHSEPGHTLNHHVKSVVNPRRVCCMIGCHEAARVSGRTVDSHGETVSAHFRRRPQQQDVIRINHYAVKSFQEFMQKRARGRARGKQRYRPMDYFTQYDLNDQE